MHAGRAASGQRPTRPAAQGRACAIPATSGPGPAAFHRAQRRRQAPGFLHRPGSQGDECAKIRWPKDLSACEKGEQWQQALDLFVVEQSVELLPDVITCNTSIVCEKRERWQQTLGLLGSPDAFPNSVTHSAAISACEKGEQLQQAVEL